MLFNKAFHEGLRDGSVTLTFRLWKKPQAKSGGRYRCHPIGWLEVGAVDRVPLEEISEDDARRCGFESREDLIAYLEKISRSRLEADTEVYRVELRYAGPDEGPVLAFEDALSGDDVTEISTRLDRMDRLSRHGAWTAETLALIEAQPRTSASRLAPQVGRETRPFKADVRKLKKLGLTVSHEVGYEISPRGRAFLGTDRR